MEVTLEKIMSADRFIVYFSGGKDSTALLLYLLEAGVDKSKIELWHHEVDGREKTFMEWPITSSYCQAFADAFGVPIYFSYKVGGLKGEILRENSLTSPIVFEDQNKNLVTVGGKRGKLSTRRKFPQVSAQLKTRFCTPYTKIDVAAMAIINQTRFRNSTTIVLSGERGQESTARAKYKIMELDRADGSLTRHKRTIIRYRPILNWSEQQVWDIIKKYRIRSHPSYYLGFARCSCLYCVFANKNQFASAYKIAPQQGDEIMSMEREFGVSIKRNIYLDKLIESGTPYSATDNPELLAISRSKNYTLPIFFDIDQRWELPAGAFGDSCGPS